MVFFEKSLEYFKTVRGEVFYFKNVIFFLHFKSNSLRSSRVRFVLKLSTC
jgi:hypothetical protein